VISTRTLSAIAILTAGALIAAQAASIPAKAQVAQVLMESAWSNSSQPAIPRVPGRGPISRPRPGSVFRPSTERSGVDRRRRRKPRLRPDPDGGDLVAPGERGVAVFAAHRDTHFAFLGDVKPGDAVRVEQPMARAPSASRVSEVVRWDQSGIVAHDGGRPRIALVTCWPLGARHPARCAMSFGRSWTPLSLRNHLQAPGRLRLEPFLCRRHHFVRCDALVVLELGPTHLQAAAAIVRIRKQLHPVADIGNVVAPRLLQLGLDDAIDFRLRLLVVASSVAMAWIWFCTSSIVSGATSSATAM